MQCFNLDRRSQEKARSRNDLDRFYEQQQVMMMHFATILSQIQQKHIRSYEDLVDRDTEAKKILIELAQKAEPIPMNGNNVAFFGSTSTGKSTLVNALLGEKLAKTGPGETTTQITPYSGTQFILWDIPGRNDEVAYLSMEYICFFKGLTRRLILIESTVKENSSMMKLLDDINLQYDIVVNKFDLVDEDERQGFKDQIQHEIETLKLNQVNRVFYVSAKHPQMFPDWIEMIDYLTN